MATQRILQNESADWKLEHLAVIPRMRALAWDGNVLYGSRGYALYRIDYANGALVEKEVARYRPAWWRNVSATARLSFRLFRDGFHALAVMPGGHLLAAVPRAIIKLSAGESEFVLSHRVMRGTRPLHIAVTPGGHAFWGEYFDNPGRDEVQIYGSTDRGATWNVAYTFPRGAIRHVHNIVYDEWENCLWVLTGDNGTECRILRAACDFSTVDVALSGTQQARAVALIPARDALYFSSDSPLEKNHIYRMDRRTSLMEVANLSSSSIHACRVGECLFFSTMVEPSAVNSSREAVLYGSNDGVSWRREFAWKKDAWPMGLFQYGNICLPGGVNGTNILAASTIGVRGADLETNLWRVQP